MGAFEGFEAGVGDGEGVVDEVLEAGAWSSWEGSGHGVDARLHLIHLTFVCTVHGLEYRLSRVGGILQTSYKIVSYLNPDKNRDMEQF